MSEGDILSWNSREGGAPLGREGWDEDEERLGCGSVTGDGKTVGSVNDPLGGSTRSIERSDCRLVAPQI